MSISFSFIASKRKRNRLKEKEKTLNNINAFGIETLLTQSAAQRFLAELKNLYAVLLC